MLNEENASSIISQTNRDILPMSMTVWRPRSKRQWYPAIKFVVEWVLALLLVVLFSPGLVILAILVRATSPGPVIYRQSRLGYRGRVFQIFKLRTMVKDAELETGPVWASKEDRRVTSLGAILRITHLDELPQLFNVLRGEMSLIGPRPERPEIASQIAQALPAFRKRLAVRPGLTGLAQVLLPADDPEDSTLDCVRRKLECDLFYARNIRFLLDVRIYVSTAFRMVALLMESVCRALTNPCRAAVQNDRPLSDESVRCEHVA
jgi:lipopolysaccharide/colanic/teichoic acid biosynthesis glycosyltransferase